MKYKVYDIQTEKMYKVVSIDFYVGHIIATESDPVFHIIELPYDSSDFSILMPRTGLVDNNNTELYETDVIVDNVGRVWSIYYRENLAMFVFLYRGQKKSWQNYMQFNKPQKPLYKIGNLLENPKIIAGFY